MGAKRPTSEAAPERDHVKVSEAAVNVPVAPLVLMCLFPSILEVVTQLKSQLQEIVMVQ